MNVHDFEFPSKQRIVIGTAAGEIKVFNADLDNLSSFHNSANHVSADLCIAYIEYT